MSTPFFVAGSGRSGTTLLYRLLEGHPRIALTNEAGVADLLRVFVEMAAVPAWQPHDIPRGEVTRLHGYVRPPYLPIAGEVVRRNAVRALEEFYAESFPDKAYSHFGDKLPEPETVIALQAVYPKVGIVVLARDPRDVVCSIRSFARKERVAAENPFFGSAGLVDTAIYWSNCYAGLLDYGRDVHVLRYEDLVAAPVERAAGVLEWLGLPADDAERRRMAAVGELAGHRTTASAGSSVGRWRLDLRDDEAAQILDRCAPVMQRLGYPVV